MQPDNGRILDECLRYGHRPANPRFFGPGRTFYARFCRRCFYSECGRMLINYALGTIKMDLQKRYGAYRKSVAEESMIGVDEVIENGEDTVKTGMDNVKWE